MSRNQPENPVCPYESNTWDRFEQMVIVEKIHGHGKNHSRSFGGLILRKAVEVANWLLLARRQAPGYRKVWDRDAYADRLFLRLT